jgi:uncharacterized damage-inducible protein DinB
MMNQPEVWLRGPLDGIPAELQPVAHAVKQAQEEIHAVMTDFPADLLWEKPLGMASPGFHLLHIAGVLDRMVTYAKGETLSESQFDYLRKEGGPIAGFTSRNLWEKLDSQMDDFLAFVAQLEPKSLADYRSVGRANLPSTVGGLVFHAAEHTQRHVGQLLVTAKVVQSSGLK